MPRLLYIAGFPATVTAKDLGAEFEKYGRIIRCDIPPTKHYNAVPYGFVEYVDPADAEVAWKDMHNARIEGARITVEWARRDPSTAWRVKNQGSDRDGDTRSHRSRSSWDERDSRDTNGRYYREDRDDYRAGDDRHPRMDERTQSIDRYCDENATSRPPLRDRENDHGDERRRRTGDYDRHYEGTRDRESGRTAPRDHDHSDIRVDDVRRSRVYSREEESPSKRHNIGHRASETEEDRDERRYESEKRRSRSPRRDSGYADSTARIVRDRHSSSYSQEYRDEDHHKRTKIDSPTRSSHHHERDYREDRRYEKRPESARKSDVTFRSSPVKAVRDRSSPSSAMRSSAPNRDFY